MMHAPHMTTTTKTDLTVANTIAAQIGGKAFFMMGTQYKVGGTDSLSFNIRGSRTVNKIRVTLTPADLYTVTFYKTAKRGLEVKTVAEVDGVYCDQLREIIEHRTGLALSL